MREYGEFIEEIINISGQKYYLLAKKLGYDVSYISKWIKGTKLPSKKNIAEINHGIVDFIIESINETSTEKIISLYDDINIIDNENKLESIKSFIEKNLSESYSYSLEKNRNKKNQINKSNDELELKGDKSLIYNNANITLNPSLKKKLLDSVFQKEVEDRDYIEIITMSNLFSLNDSDKIYTLKVTSTLLKENKIKKIKYILNIDNIDSNDIVYNTILFINIATQHQNLRIDFYEYDFPSYTLVTVVKDIVMHSAIYNKNRQCFLTSSSVDKEIINEAYDTLQDIINNQSSKIFNRYNNLDEIIKNKIYNKYILSNNIRILMGNIDEMFMPKNLLLEIGNMIFSDNDINNELLEINNILINITYKRKMKILIYEKSIIDYMLKGEIIFFNKKIKLTMNQIKEHFNYFEKTILENDNIEIGLIKDDFIEEFKHFNNPSLYLSKMSNLLRCTNEDNEEFLINNSGNLTELFNEFYEKIWEDEKDKIIFDKKAIFETIKNDFEYII